MPCPGAHAGDILPRRDLGRVRAGRQARRRRDKRLARQDLERRDRNRGATQWASKGV